MAAETVRPNFPGGSESGRCPRWQVTGGGRQAL